MPKEIDSITNFIFEVGQMKKVKRSGWWLANIPNPESVAEHSHRTAIIAYVLAEMEGCKEANEIAVTALFHDLIETRLLDLHKVHTKYSRVSDEIKEKVREEQYALLPGRIRKDLLENVKIAKKNKDIIKDADYLEVAFQAKEYSEAGWKDADDWIKRVGGVLKTKSARQLYEKMKKTKSTSWWYALKEEVKKLKY